MYQMAEKRTGEFASETIICTFADDLGITINFVKMITKKTTMAMNESGISSGRWSPTNVPSPVTFVSMVP